MVITKIISLFRRWRDRRNWAFLKRMPWYVVLGEPGCGKSSFISHANFNCMPIEKLANVLNVTSNNSNHINLYFSNSAVILELTLEAKIKAANEIADFLVDINKLVNRFCGFKTISAALMAIDVTKLILDLEHLLKKIHLFNGVLLKINNDLKKPLPAYFLFTHCDHVYGFNEFFSDKQDKQANDIWGICLDPTNTKNNYLDHFREKYAQFIGVLNEKMLLKLAGQQNVMSKGAIYSFPLQMQLFLEPILNLIKHCQPNNIARGIYFISNRQSGECHDFIMGSLGERFNFSTARSIKNNVDENHKFARNVFEQAVLLETKPSKYAWLKACLKFNTYSFLIFLVLFFAVGSSILIYSYSQRANVIKQEFNINFNNLTHAIKILDILVAQKKVGKSFVGDKSILDLSRIIKSTEKNQEQYFRIVQGLMVLRDYLKAINASSNVNQAEFVEVANIIARNSAKNPIFQLKQLATYESQPLKKALDDVANESLGLLFRDTHQWINSIWQSTVVPLHQNTIKGKFPFKKDAALGVDFADFESFFGSQGVFIKFFTHYLQPLLNTKKYPWQLYQVDNYSLGLSRNTLEQLQKAYLIHATYFKYGAANISFFIKPHNLDAQAKSVVLQLGKQNLIYRHDPAVALTWQWPSVARTDEAKILFNDFHGNSFSQVTDSVWAFFKLLSLGQVYKDDVSGHTIWSISQNKHQASFEIWTSSHMPVFNLGMLQSFDLPKSI